MDIITPEVMQRIGNTFQLIADLGKDADTEICIWLGMAQIKCQK